MTISVNNNQSALIALQNLNQTQGDLQTVQNAISTGLRINNPKDNAAIWAIAQGQRADIGALDAVKMSLDRANSIAQVSMTAGQSISDTLIQMKAKVTAALDPSFDPNSRKALNADYVTLLNQVQQMVNNATFDGANILNGSMTGNIKFLANADANSFLTLSVKNMSLGGAIITMPATSTISTVTMATAALAQIQATMANVSQALGDMGAQAKQIESHNTFVGKLKDSLDAGVGNLVDADLAKESAKLQALQVKQQLGAQALSIANSAPQVVLSLFKQG